MEPDVSWPGVTSIDGAFVRRIARGLLDPLNLLALPVILLLLIARQHGLTTRRATWQIVAFYLVVHFSAAIFQLCFPPGTSRARPIPFLVMLIGTSGAFMYVLGWGSILGVSLITGAAIAIASDGSRFGRPAMGIVLVTILAGESAVEVGVVGSILPTATGHIVALIGASVAIALITLLTRGQRGLERAEAGKQATEERFRALIQHASDAILVVDEHGTVTYASPAASQLLRCEPTQLQRFDLTWFESNDIDAVVELWEKLAERPGAVATIEVPLRRPDNSSNWFEIHFTNLTQNPAVAGVVCNLRDVNERRVAQQGLLHDLQHDPLTLLPNRRYFLEHLEQACRNSAPDQIVALLFIDVDHFKHINDDLGHAAGDEVLSAVGRTLSEALRPGDIVARFAGDEFVALLTGLGEPNAAIVVADRMAAELLCTPPIVGGHELKVSVSIGVATSRGGSRSGAELLRRADEAMYLAKQQGRGRWALIDCQPAEDDPGLPLHASV